MKSLFKNLSAINKPAWKSIPGISFSLCTSLLTIGTSVGIGITFNPERSLAGSTCAGVYSSRSGSPSLIGYYNSISKSYVNVATYAGSTNINAIATQPSTGNLFFVDRNTGKTIVYNPNTGTQSTLTGSISNPTTIIGATFNPSGKLYVYYGTSKTLIEVDPATGSQVGSTINISGIPGNSGGGTNGDIAIGTDGVLYAVGDTSSSGSNFTSQLYSITIAGTTATATPVNGNNNISGVSGAAVNGLAIDPSTNKFYISTNLGTYELDFATKVGTLLTSATGTNDLAACGSPTPDLPTINKSFSPDTITNIPATTTLTLTLGNTNSVPIYLIQALTDNFQSGLTVSTSNGLSGTCTTIPGNTITATAGSNSISLNDGFKIPAGGCTVAVNVTASSAGTYVNNIPVGALKTFVGDNANAATSTLTVTSSISISGTVFGDRDGGKLQNATEVGTNAGGLNAVLINSSNQVVAITAVPTSGIYTFSNVPANANYTVEITTATATVGSAPPVITLPSNWVSTGENLNSTIDGTVDGKVSVLVTTSNVTGVNFGVEQLPDTTAVNGTSQTNPGGKTTVQVPDLSGIDPEDGTLGTGKSFKIITLPTNGTLSYDGAAVTAGQVINSYDPTKLTIDPNDGTITVSFTYAAVDSAGKEDPTPATATMPFKGSTVKVLLVKRITAINATPINKYVDDTTSVKKDDDSHPNWPAPLNSDSNLGDITTSTFLRGLIDGGTVRPSDEVEYTIYFLATGNSPATNVNFCDLVPANVTFIPTSFTGKTPGDGGVAGADAGIQLTIGNTTTYLTNVADGDRGEYFAPGTTPSVKCPSGNSNGAVVVKVVNSQAPAPNDELPNATAPGTPTGSYGFIRFRGRVK
jgi:hypothetical protein